MTASTLTIAPGTYRLDTRRSTIRFRIRGMFGLAEVTGTFAVRDGTVTVTDPAGAAEVVATVDATSVDTANARRDKDLRSKRFLHVSEYPAMFFRSTGLTLVPAADGEWSLAGELTVRDTTTLVTLSIQRPLPVAGGFRCRATTTVDRYAAGVTAARGFIKQYVTLDFDVIAAR
jgi:polyisoprenoid-binding protein YceI